MHVTTQHTLGSSCELHFTFGAEQALDFTKTRINVMHSAYLILRKLTCHILFFSSTCKCWSPSVPTPGSDNLNIDCSWGPGSSTCHAEELVQLPCLIQAEVIRENRKASVMKWKKILKLAEKIRQVSRLVLVTTKNFRGFKKAQRQETALITLSVSSFHVLLPLSLHLSNCYRST